MDKEERKFLGKLATSFAREGVRVEAREQYDNSERYVGTRIVFVHEDGTEDLATI